MKLVNPLEEFGSLLNTVQSPSRYLGGEYGITVKEHTENDSLFNVAIAFPDLYEIGMSNMAVKIIYNGLNGYDDIRCERVFAVDTDFENLLKTKNVPLYTLETGMPLCETDVIGFSLGYELGITNVLSCLELGGVPLTAEERTENDPIVIAGGCGVTNPAPISDFFDAVFIGEAENTFFEIIEQLSEMKKSGASRNELLKLLDEHPNVWTKNSAFNSSKTARKAFWNEFGLVPSVQSWFPLSNQKAVQEHGVVEIMRGCPNGCRFCHAGVYYRPQRIKSKELIIQETDHLVFDAGYREVSLTSLSSADYPDIENLLDTLNERYKGYNVSFQLPSLKVNSLSLPIFEKLSTVRRSGLTFAVETPEEMWQLSLNKEVYAQHLKEIILEAKDRGWSSAKFYFMIGLPVGNYFGKENNPTGKSEEETIVEFMTQLQAETRIQCNVNVGVFIPKPHTAYQWVKQITPEEAKAKMEYIFTNLPRGKFKVNRGNYYATVLEGLLSRGNFETGKVILNAYKKGARLDAWDEHLRQNEQYWEEAFNEASFDVKKYIYKDWNIEEKLPWDSVNLGPSKAFFKKEWQNSIDHVLTKKCSAECDHPCGVCNSKGLKVHSVEEVKKSSENIKIESVRPIKLYPQSNIQVLYRVVFTVRRNRGAEYLAYLSQIEVFHKAMLRCALPVVYTTGFNPLPRIEFATAMTIGIPSEEEMVTTLMYEPVSEETFIKTMNSVLPDIFHVTKAFIFPVTNQRKRESLSESLWGTVYRYEFKPESDVKAFLQSDVFLQYKNAFEKEYFEYSELYPYVYEFKLPFHQDKKFRLMIEEFFGKKYYEVAAVTKVKSLAKPEISGWTHENEVAWRKQFDVTDNRMGTDDSSADGIYDGQYKTAGEININDKEKSVPGAPVDFYELYERIAEVNAQLMADREMLNQKKEEFFKEHPELIEKYNSKK